MKVLGLITTALVAASSASGYRITTWASQDFQGASKSRANVGTLSPGYNIKSWKWTSVVNDGCCVIFCQAKQEKGRYCGTASNAKSTAGAYYAKIGCRGSPPLKCNGA